MQLAMAAMSAVMGSGAAAGGAAAAGAAAAGTAAAGTAAGGVSAAAGLGSTASMILQGVAGVTVHPCWLVCF